MASLRITIVRSCLRERRQAWALPKFFGQFSSRKYTSSRSKISRIREEVLWVAGSIAVTVPSCWYLLSNRTSHKTHPEDHDNNEVNSDHDDNYTNSDHENNDTSSDQYLQEEISTESESGIQDPNELDKNLEDSRETDENLEDNRETDENQNISSDNEGSNTTLRTD